MISYDDEYCHQGLVGTIRIDIPKLFRIFVV